MNAPINLPPELQEVEDELQEASKRGDLAACRALVSKLSAEAEFGRTIGDEAELAILEIEENMDIFPEIRETAPTHINELARTKLAGMLATLRYTYAAARLGEIERAAL